MEQRKAICYCPVCGLEYIFIDGEQYPHSHGPSGVCDACRMEEVIDKKLLYFYPNVVSEVMNDYSDLDHRKGDRELIERISRIIDGFTLSRQEVATVIDLCDDLQARKKMFRKIMVNYAGGMATLQQCKDRLIGYLERLGEAKLRDLTCLMFLGRNLDLYGLCREIVVEFESRAGESLAYGADELAERPHLGEWLRLVAEAEE